ncbi:uncharacterized protein AB9X84_014943 isoform 2-T2 [Acanthopagrus schlegelii]
MVSDDVTTLLSSSVFVFVVFSGHEINAHAIEQKNYLKLQKKHSKELKELCKKQLKKVWNLSKEQKSQSSQMQSDGQRNLKRSIKKKLLTSPDISSAAACCIRMSPAALGSCTLTEWSVPRPAICQAV